MKDLDTERYYDLVLEAADDKLLAGTVKKSSLEDDVGDVPIPPDEICFAKAINAPFPIFGLGDIEIPCEDPKLVFIVPQNRVLVDGCPYYFRRCHYYDITASEVVKHTRIANSGLSVTELRCVRLFAIVQDKAGYIHGLLYHWIEEEQPLSFAVTFTSLQSSMNQLRQKWADQIRATVAKMHALGVIWGDVKANNVLIDKNNEAWVIDLEGGTSQGLVDPENEGTLEGDAQGMEKLMDFIFNDNCPLRPRDESDKE